MVQRHSTDGSLGRCRAGKVLLFPVLRQAPHSEKRVDDVGACPKEHAPFRAVRCGGHGATCTPYVDGMSSLCSRVERHAVGGTRSSGLPCELASRPTRRARDQGRRRGGGDANSGWVSLLSFCLGCIRAAPLSALPSTAACSATGQRRPLRPVEDFSAASQSHAPPSQRAPGTP